MVQKGSRKDPKSIKHCSRHQPAEPVTRGEDLRPIRAFDGSGTSQPQLQDIVHDTRREKLPDSDETQRENA